VVELEVLRHGTVAKLRRRGRGARGRIDLNGDLILSATFRLPLGKKEELMRCRREWLVRRNVAEPINLANTGRIFKDPPGVRAATLIEESGMRGRRHGRARVSERYPNAIVTEYGARAADVHALIQLMQQTVRNHSGVSLDLQVKLIGFEGYTRHSEV
jgi:UDP-N-acetylmuramate dehydrogenase